jgi:hypothetical protein
MRKAFFIFLLVAASCIRPEDPPVNLIPKDTMSQLLIDIHLAEAKIALRGINPDTAQLLYEAQKRKIYKTHNITPERFQESFEYYSRNLEEFDKVYQVVVDSLSLREGTGRLEP